MAIDAKVSFLRQIEKACEDKLTVKDMTELMRTISDVMQGFRMEELRSAEEYRDDDLLDSFIDALKVQGRSEKTIRRYRFIIGKFQDFAKTPTRNINVYHIRGWIAAEKERGIKDSTLEGNRQVLSSYFGWLFRESLIEKNPIVNVGVIKVAKKHKRIYSETDIARLDRECETKRDRAIMHFLRATGCRISEMTQLNRDQINYEKMECIVHGKGDKERTVYLDEVARMHLMEYMEERQDVSEALFVGCRQERLTPGGVRCMLKQLGERAGVDHVHPHKFRRTLATEMSRHGMQIQKVAAILGHEKLDTTMEYVVNNNEDTHADYRRYA